MDSMSVQGYTQPAIIAAYSKAVSVEYTYVAAITLILYDTLIVFHREQKHIYKGRQTLIKWIYILIKVGGITILALNFVGKPILPSPLLTMSETRPNQHIEYHLKHQQCLVRQWLAGFLFEVVDTAVIKTLLVLRLRALYQNNRFVSILLWTATAVELISTIYAYTLTGLNMQRFIVSPAPIPGCPLQKMNDLKHFRSPTVVWATRFSSNFLELILLLFGLRRSLKEIKSTLRLGLSKIRTLAPILYVFYRDGTIFYLPVCTLSMFGLVATLTNLTLELTCSNWEAWLSITYYIVGTRLILNIREAGLKFSTSMITEQQISTIAFQSANTAGQQQCKSGGESSVEGEDSTLEEEQEEERAGV